MGCDRHCTWATEPGCVNQTALGKVRDEKSTSGMAAAVDRAARDRAGVGLGTLTGGLLSGLGGAIGEPAAGRVSGLGCVKSD